MERVDAVVPIKPSCCGHCGHALAGKDPHPQRHQVIDIPPVRTRVTEYQLHTLRYPQCQMLSEAEWPERVPRSAFGPTVQAWVGLLSGAYRLSKRNIVTLLSGVFDIDLGLGSVSQLEQHVSAAIAAPVAQARDYVRRQAAVHIAKPVGAKPATRPGCGRWPATRLRCSTFAGTAIPRWPVTCWAADTTAVVGSDRYTAYGYLPVRQRQRCWAHLHQPAPDRAGPVDLRPKGRRRAPDP